MRLVLSFATALAVFFTLPAFAQLVSCEFDVSKIKFNDRSRKALDEMVDGDSIGLQLTFRDQTTRKNAVKTLRARGVFIAKEHFLADSNLISIREQLRSVALWTLSTPGLVSVSDYRTYGRTLEKARRSALDKIHPDKQNLWRELSTDPTRKLTLMLIIGWDQPSFETIVGEISRPPQNQVRDPYFNAAQDVGYVTITAPISELTRILENYSKIDGAQIQGR
jgi:hypothetical protein